MLLEGAASLPQRRGFRRTKLLNTSMSLTSAALTQLATTFLAGHTSTPLKGTLTVPSATSIQRIPGGAWVKPSELASLTGELILFPYMHDPDTGALGRVGRIASVTVDLKNGVASVQIDNETQTFDAVLSRLALITGQVR